jgi:hypothetical protein
MRNEMKSILLYAMAYCATISFGAEYKNKVDGLLQQGSNVTIKYDLERARCSLGSYAGVPTRSVVLMYTVNGQDPKEIVVESYSRNNENSGADRYHVDPIIPLTQKGDLAIWFRCSSRAGTEYDSDFGKNFNFKIHEMPRIVFKKDFTHSVENGPLMVGGTVIVDYDLARAPCRDFTMNGISTKNVQLNYELNGQVGQETLLYQNNGSPQPKITPVIQGLQGKLAIWFHCSSRLDALAFDSNHSQNYNFDIQ